MTILLLATTVCILALPVFLAMLDRAVVRSELALATTIAELTECYERAVATGDIATADQLEAEIREAHKVLAAGR